MEQPDGAAEETSEGLTRAIGTRGLALNIVNLVVGGGIFVLPGVLAAGLGPAAVIAYAVCAVAVALVFLCFAEAGSRVSRSGGAYAYIETAFGPFAGYISSLLLWFGWDVLSEAAISVALVDTVAAAVPALGSPVARALFTLLLLGGLAAVNVAGVRTGARFAALVTYAKLVPLLALVGFGLFAVRVEHLAIPEWPSLAGVGSGALVLIFAFGGAEIALNTGGEIRDPARTVPRGLAAGIGSVFVLYMAIHGVAQGVLGPELAAHVETPLAATAGRVMGAWGRSLLLAGAGLSIFGCLAADMLAGPRAVFAAARAGLLPSVLGRVHPTRRTPHVAILFYAALVCGFALSGTFKTLAVVSSGSVLLIYLGTSFAVLKLRRQGVRSGETVFVAPGGPLVPVLSVLVVLWLLSSMTRGEALGLVALVAAAALAYLGWRVVPRR